MQGAAAVSKNTTPPLLRTTTVETGNKSDGAIASPQLVCSSLPAAVSKQVTHRSCKNLTTIEKNARDQLQKLLAQLKNPGQPFTCTYETFERQLCDTVNTIAQFHPDMILVAPDSKGIPKPLITLAATKTLVEQHKFSDGALKRRLARTQWIELVDDMQSNITVLSRVVDQELKHCRAYYTEKSGSWIPLMVDAHGHITNCLMRWTGNAMMVVITGSLGYKLYVENDTTGSLPKMLFQGDDATGALTLCMSKVITDVCNTHLRSYHQHIFGKLKKSDLTPQQQAEWVAQEAQKLFSVCGQILFLEPQRQNDYISCSAFALHDLLSLLPKSATSELTGKKVQLVKPVDLAELPEDGACIPVSVEKLDQYQDINYFKLTKYPVTLLKPTQSLSVIESELARLKDKSPTEHEKFEQLHQDLKPYIREFQGEEQQKKKLNTYAITCYLENLFTLLESTSTS